MRIASTWMRISKEEPYKEREQESVFSAKNGKEVVDKWVKWFRKELLEAMEKGEDVDILLGRKPSNDGEYLR